jgi:hypothetical protein
MKNKRPLFVVLLCLLLAGGVVLALIPCSPMPWQCSKLYWQYRGQEGIKATYVKQYPVDDTTLVDVTLLHATTDSAWESLCHEFVPYEFADSNKYINNLIHDTTSITFRAVSKDDCRTKVNPSISEKHNSVFMAAKMRAICIFHINKKEQSDILIDIMLEHFLSSNTQSLLP